MKKEFLSLIGCGWLGKPLALDLIQSGYSILATTSHDKSSEFSASAVPYTTLDISSHTVPAPILNSDVLIYMVTPKPLAEVQHFFEQIPADKKIIFISSTSVYGKSMGEINEGIPLDPNNTSSPLLIETESYIKTKFKNATILRFGGLYGDKRHPVFHLQGKTNLTGGGAYIHLVHRDDCIRAIKSVIEHSCWGEIFNIVSDVSFNKKDYYTLMAIKLGLTPPTYTENAAINETKITNEKSKEKLNMHYQKPSEFYTSSV